MDIAYGIHTGHENAYKIFAEWDHLEDLDVEGRLLKLILNKQFEVWTGLIWLRIGSIANSSEHSNESSGSIKGEEFLN